MSVIDEIDAATVAFYEIRSFEEAVAWKERSLLMQASCLSSMQLLEAEISELEEDRSREIRDYNNMNPFRRFIASNPNLLYDKKVTSLRNQQLEYQQAIERVTAFAQFVPTTISELHAIRKTLQLQKKELLQQKREIGQKLRSIREEYQRRRSRALVVPGGLGRVSRADVAISRDDALAPVQALRDQVESELNAL